MEFTKKVYSTVIVLMLLCLSPLTAQAQTNTVKGTVTSSDGPVIGATVKVKGSSTGVVTDMDGNYTIKVKPGDVLSFTYLGMTTKEVKVGKQATINVTLSEDDKLLEEVVVVGYGKMKRSDLTGSVVSLLSARLPVLREDQRHPLWSLDKDKHHLRCRLSAQVVIQGLLRWYCR